MARPRRSSLVSCIWLVSACAPGASTDGPEAGGDSGSSSGPGSAATVPPRCDGGSDGWTPGSSDDSSMGFGDDMPLVTDIAQIQAGAIDLLTWVELQDVVVISPKVDSEASAKDEFFVQDPAGGPWSGLMLRVPSSAVIPDVGEAIDVIGLLRPRHDYYVLDVVLPDEYIVPLGPAQIPPPVVVPVAELALVTESSNPYEGIGVRVEQVMVSNDAPCEGEFVLDDVVRVDDRYVPTQLDAPPVGTTLASVEGVLVYVTDALELSPLDPADVQ